MNKDKNNSFVFYESYFDSADSLTDNKAFRELITAFCKYAFYGEIIDFKNEFVKAIFYAHKTNIDYSIKRRKQNIENGLKGGAPKGTINNPNGYNQYNSNEDNQRITDGKPMDNQIINSGIPTDNLNVNGDVNLNGDVNPYEKENSYEKAYGDSYGKVNPNVNGYKGLVKLDPGKVINDLKKESKTLLLKNVKDLAPSDLNHIAPELDINFKVSYYDHLKDNHFQGLITKDYISSVDSMIKDLLLYAKEQ